MKSDKGQSLILVGIALLLLAGLCLYIGLSQPKISAGVLMETPTGAAPSNTPTAGMTAAGDTAAIAEQNSEADLKPSAQEQAQAVQMPVNLNTATLEQLTAIEGIGAQRAAAILAYRDRLGKYTSVEQIKEISGIGDGLYAKIAPYLTV